MNCQELKFQQSCKKTSETRGNSHSFLRRACVSLVSPLCSGGAVSTSSMADPASLPLAAVSVSASNSRHSTRKRVNPTQPEKAKAKRPRTRSQDSGAFHETSTDKNFKKGKFKQLTSNSFETSITRSSLRNSKSSDKNATLTATNNKINNNLQLSTITTGKNKSSISLIETGTADLHHKSISKRSQLPSCSVNSNEEIAETTSKRKKPFTIEPGTSRWDVTTTKKISKKIKESKSLDGEPGVHKYTLRSQVRLSGPESFEKTTVEDQIEQKALATNKKKHKVCIHWYLQIY